MKEGGRDAEGKTSFGKKDTSSRPCVSEGCRRGKVPMIATHAKKVMSQ